MTKYKHLTYEDRVTIKNRLRDRFSLSKIAKELNCSPSTVSREISRHLHNIDSKGCNCGRYYECRKRKLCLSCRLHRACKTCATAKTVCPDYIPPDCSTRKHLGLCNACTSFAVCELQKICYVPDMAQEAADQALKETRQGFRISEEQINEIDKLVSPLIKQGQSPYAARIAVCDELGISERTLYRYIDAKKLTVKNLDLRWKIKMRGPKKKYKYKHEPNTDILKEGHRFEDFKKWQEDNPGKHYVEIDTVESSEPKIFGILTILFTENDLQLGYIVRQGISADVITVFNNIEAAIGRKRFRELFPIVLADNGSEFDGFIKLETSIYGGKRTKVYFCRPNRSGDKGLCEHNHTLIRTVLPKGTNFTELTQFELDKVMNNINSYCREKLSDLCPIDLAFRDYDIKVINALHLSKIDPKKVNLTKTLLKQFYKRTNQQSHYLGESLYGPDFSPSNSDT